MKKAIITTLILSTTLSLAHSRALTAVPVHDKPTWQVITGTPDAPGAPVVVRSLSTDQVLGSLPIDARFLSFGTNGQIVTFSINGEMVYVPSSAVSRLYPEAPKPESAPPGRYSLDKLAQEYEDRVNGRAAVSLTMKDSIVSEVKGRQNAASTINMPSPGTGIGMVDPNNPQPGAALIQGGMPALQNMANPYGQPNNPGGSPGLPGPNRK